MLGLHSDACRKPRWVLTCDSPCRPVPRWVVFLSSLVICSHLAVTSPPSRPLTVLSCVCLAPQPFVCKAPCLHEHLNKPQESRCTKPVSEAWDPEREPPVGLNQHNHRGWWSKERFVASPYPEVPSGVGFGMPPGSVSGTCH